MSEAKHGLQITTAHASGWCDPDTGVCHLGPDDDRAAAVTADTAPDEGAGDSAR